jgi:lipoprotein-anchoring transpeptidase ErfK/SrfK
MLQQEGRIPSGVDNPGDRLGIHGGGSGKASTRGGNYWTAGCVALSDEQVAELYDLVNVGTPVTIVREW